jgi:peptidoglycan/LPS O-acetylase OafA/YrhL
MPQDQILSISERSERPALPTYSLHLDLIRGLAALVVLAGHLHLVVSGQRESVTNAGQAPGLMVHAPNATDLTHSAVVVFFVLSGYLVGGSVLRDLKRNGFSWSKYALRRLARLWTVLVPTLVLGAVIDAVSLHVFPWTRVVSMGEFSKGLQGWPGALQFLRYLGFLQSINRLGIPQFGTDGALWSLSNEFWYYALFPLLAISLIGTRYPKLLRAVLAVLAIFLLWFLGAGITAYFPLWLCGVVAYLAPAKIPARFQGLATVVLSIQFCYIVFLMRSHEVGALRADVLIALSFTSLLYAILHQVGPASVSLYSRVAHLVSFPSYSLYAIHQPMCILLAAFCEAMFPQIFRHTTLACAIIGALVLGYAGIFYRLFERNTERIRRFVEARFLRSGPPDHSQKSLTGGKRQRMQPVKVNAGSDSGA